MDGKVNKREKHLMTDGQATKFLRFICGDDLDFYEEHLMDLSDEELNQFLNQNPDFMSEFPVEREYMYLLKDSVYRGVLRKIKRYNVNKAEE